MLAAQFGCNLARIKQETDQMYLIKLSFYHMHCINVDLISLFSSMLEFNFLNYLHCIIIISLVGPISEFLFQVRTATLQQTYS